MPAPIGPPKSRKGRAALSARYRDPTQSGSLSGLSVPRGLT